MEPKMINKRLCWIAAARFVMSGWCSECSISSVPGSGGGGYQSVLRRHYAQFVVLGLRYYGRVPPTPINPNQPVWHWSEWKVGVADGIRVAG